MLLQKVFPRLRRTSLIDKILPAKETKQVKMGKRRKPDYSVDRGDEDYVWKKDEDEDEDDVKEVDDDDLDHDKLLKQETMKQFSESIKKIVDMENDEVDAPMDGDHIAFTKVLTSLLGVISSDALSRTYYI